MDNRNWGDVIGNAFQQVLWRETALRQRIYGAHTYEDIRTILVVTSSVVDARPPTK